MMSPVALPERFNATLVPAILFGKADSMHAGWAGESLLSSPRSCVIGEVVVGMESAMFGWLMSED
jgi:hypothetical protein